MTGQRQCKIEKSINSANGTYSGGHQSLCLLNYLRSKNTLKQGTFLILFKLTAKPRVLENLKRSWKKPWKVYLFIYLFIYYLFKDSYNVQGREQ